LQDDFRRCGRRADAASPGRGLDEVGAGIERSDGNFAYQQWIGKLAGLDDRFDQSRSAGFLAFRHDQRPAPAIAANVGPPGKYQVDLVCACGECTPRLAMRPAHVIGAIREVDHRCNSDGGRPSLVKRHSSRDDVLWIDTDCRRLNGRRSRLGAKRSYRARRIVLAEAREIERREEPVLQGRKNANGSSSSMLALCVWPPCQGK